MVGDEIEVTDNLLHKRRKLEREFHRVVVVQAVEGGGELF